VFHGRPELDLWVALTPGGCQIGYMGDQNSTYGLHSLPGCVRLVTPSHVTSRRHDALRCLRTNVRAPSIAAVTAGCMSHVKTHGEWVSPIEPCFVTVQNNVVVKSGIQPYPRRRGRRRCLAASRRGPSGSPPPPRPPGSSSSAPGTETTSRTYGCRTTPPGGVRLVTCTVLVATPGGGQIGHRHRTGCHQSAVLTTRPTSVVHSRVSLDWIRVWTVCWLS
jgi:hypothetical protein